MSTDSGKKKTLLLVDASSYLYRAYHALPGLATRSGEPTGAIYGVISMLAKLEGEYQGHYSACVFDAKGKTFRHDLYPLYKAHRPEMPKELSHQVDTLMRAIDLLGWPILAVPGVEADDVIATLARQARDKGLKVVVVSGDKDLAQIVEEDVVVVDTMKVQTLDRQRVTEKFGVPPEAIPDYLALVGDPSDNIPGVPKVGAKTAAKLLQQYDTLEKVLAHAREIGGAVGKNLLEAKDALPLSKALATVKRDVPISFRIEELRRAPVQEASYRELLRQLEFHSLLSREEKEAPKPAPDPGALILDEANLVSWCKALENSPLASLDTETDSLDPLSDCLVGLSFAAAPGKAAYLPLAHAYPGAPRQMAKERGLFLLSSWLKDPKQEKVGHHTKFDRHVLESAGVKAEGLIHDTLLQSYVLRSDERHDLDSLAEKYLNHSTTTYEEVAGKGAKQIAFSQVPLERAGPYAAEDADICLRLHQMFLPRIESDRALSFIYRQIEMPLVEVLMAMERHGVLIDTDALQRQSRALEERMQAWEEKAISLAGEPFNLNSPKQIQEILFEKRKLPIGKKTPLGAPSTNEAVLEALSGTDPLARAILEYRALTKLRNTYTEKLPQMVNPKTSRVHTSYNQSVAVTGRLASSDPNLQNIPVRSTEGRAIRSAFVAPPGQELVSADYSQIELRLMAHLSQDPGLLQAFAQGEDIHAATAAEIFGVPRGEVTAELRRRAKTVNFGLIYGISPYGLAQQLGIEREEAQAIIERTFARYPKVAEYMENTKAAARKKGYVESIFGRRIWVPEINSGSPKRRNAAERQAINAPLQGSAADIIKLAMISVFRFLQEKGLGACMILQVHDEIVLEVPEEEKDLVLAEVPRLMSQVAPLSVPLVVDAGVGGSWAQAH